MLFRSGLTAAQVVDMKALTGDTADNYPGVTKIGPVTAIKLLKEWQTLENLYDNVESLKKSKMKDNLINDREQAFMSQDLARIRTDVALPIGIADINYRGADYEGIVPFYQMLNFKQQLAKLHAAGYGKEANEAKQNNPAIKMQVITEANLAQVAALEGEISFYLETTSPNYHISEMVGFAIGNATQGDRKSVV